MLSINHLQRILQYLLVLSLLLVSASPIPQTKIQAAPAAPQKAGASTAENPAAPLTVGTSCTYSTLQAAVNAAASGATIHVEGKTWTNADATVNFTTEKSLTIIGGYDSDCSDLVESSRTKMNATGWGDNIFANMVASPLVKQSIVIENFEIYGGYAIYGGGVYVGKKVNWTFRNSLIHNNWSHYGGGISVDAGSSLYLYDTKVYTNTATTTSSPPETQSGGGGIYCQGTYSTTNVTIGDDSWIGNWTFILPSYHVKGIGNYTAGPGGGIYLNGCTLDVNDANVFYNIANLGGGIYAENESWIRLFDPNSLVTSNNAVDGAGIYLANSMILYRAGQVSYNTASQNGGGLYMKNYRQSSLIAVNNSSCLTSSPRCTQISHNSASVNGGALYLTDHANIPGLEGAVIDSNHAGGEASAIYATSGSVIGIGNSIISRGTSPGSVITADDTGGGPSIAFGNDTIANNTGNASGILVFDAASYGQLHEMIVWGNDGALVGGALNPSVWCSILQSAHAGSNNLVIDPLFVNPATGDFHIQAGSPAVDHCSYSTEFDIDNQARPFYATSKYSTPYDAGADEVFTALLFMPFVSKQ